MSLLATHAAHTSTPSPRRLTTSTSTTTTTAVSITSTADKKQSANAGVVSGTGNPYAVQLQRETEAMLRQMKPTPQTLQATTLRTFTCGSVTVHLAEIEYASTVYREFNQCRQA